MNPEPPDNSSNPHDPPVLNYSGALVEGGGHWREEVARLLDANCSPEDLRTYFTSPHEAATYFAHAMEARHMGDRDEPCLICQAMNAPRRVTVEWIARLDPKVDPGLGRADFETVHRLCEKCAQRMDERLAWDRRGELVSRIGVFALAVVTAVGVWTSLIDNVTLISLGLSWILLMVFGVILSSGSRHRWERDFRPLMPGGVEYLGVLRVDSGCNEGQCCG